MFVSSNGVHLIVATLVNPPAVSVRALPRINNPLPLTWLDDRVFSKQRRQQRR